MTAFRLSLMDGRGISTRIRRIYGRRESRSVAVGINGASGAHPHRRMTSRDLTLRRDVRRSGSLAPSNNERLSRLLFFLSFFFWPDINISLSQSQSYWTFTLGCRSSSWSPGFAFRDEQSHMGPGLKTSSKFYLYFNEETVKTENE